MYLFWVCCVVVVLRVCVVDGDLCCLTLVFGYAVRFG